MELQDSYYKVLCCCLLVQVKRLKQNYYVVAMRFSGWFLGSCWMVTSILGCCLLVQVKSLKIHFYVVASLFLVVARKLLDSCYGVLGSCQGAAVW